MQHLNQVLMFYEIEKVNDLYETNISCYENRS